MHASALVECIRVSGREVMKNEFFFELTAISLQLILQIFLLCAERLAPRSRLQVYFVFEKVFL
jgi:hypothetical protein